MNHYYEKLASSSKYLLLAIYNSVLNMKSRGNYTVSFGKTRKVMQANSHRYVTSGDKKEKQIDINVTMLKL